MTAIVPYRLLLPIALLMLVFVPLVAHGQATAGDFAWATGDLAVTIPDGWGLTNDADSLELERGAARLFVREIPTAPAFEQFPMVLTDSLSAAGYAYIDYANDTVFGVLGLRANIISLDRGRVGIAVLGRTPDGRILLIGGGAPTAERAAWETAFEELRGSLTFSASTPPTPRLYRPQWRAAGFDGVSALAGQGDRIYAAHPVRGVVVVDAATGTTVDTIPFPNPTQPTGIAATTDGIVIGDTVCRCLQVLTPVGDWGESQGAFGGNAPVRLQAGPGSLVYAIDTLNGGYALTALSGSTGSVYPLSFNATHPPLLAASSSGAVTVVEWLQSLLDSSINAAVSTVTGDVLTLQGWLPITPDTVRAAAALPSGMPVLALATGDLVIVDAVALASGTPTPLLTLEAPAAALAITADGRILVTDANGTLTLYDNSLAPDRVGHPRLRSGVPVLGTITETAPQQNWTYTAAGAERVTINAIDPSGTNAVDMAVRVYGPDGREIAYNDDHLGLDLAGIYDAQIADLILPAAGEYRLQVEWVQGSGGTYALGLLRDHTFEMAADAVTQSGRIFDTLPVERWVFNGTAGQTITITMTTEAGDLDPALELIDPFGSTLAYNDDGRDPSLGTNAQLFRVTLPVAGQYIIEASRFSGVGQYALVIVSGG